MGTRERITLQEAADRLGVHYMTAYRYVRTGRLPAQREGSKWTIDVAEVDKLTGRAQTSTSNRAVRAARPDTLAARLIAGDEAGAWTIVEDALTSALEPADVLLELLSPALRVVGDAWERGKLSVADEHQATVVADRLIGRLGPRFARRGRKRGTVIVAAPAGERHALPCAMVADLLRGAGYEVVDLGADTPADSIVESALRADRLVAVAIGVTIPRDGAVRTAIRALRAAGIDGPVVVGGAGIENEAQAHRLGADAWTGTEGSSVVAIVDDVAARETK